VYVLMLKDLSALSEGSRLGEKYREARVSQGGLGLSKQMLEKFM